MIYAIICLGLACQAWCIKYWLDTRITLARLRIEAKHRDEDIAEITELDKRIASLEAGADKFVQSINVTNQSIASTQQMLNALGLRQGLTK